MFRRAALGHGAPAWRLARGHRAIVAPLPLRGRGPHRGEIERVRFAQERGVGVFYWLDRKLGYALSGEVEKAELLRVATAVYRQLNP